MSFKEFNQKIQQQFAKMCATGKLLKYIAKNKNDNIGN